MSDSTGMLQAIGILPFAKTWQMQVNTVFFDGDIDKSMLIWELTK